MANKRIKILVIADFPLYKNKVHGGLQRRLLPVLKSLAVHYDVHLFCGERSDIQLQNVKVDEAYNPKCVLTERYIQPLKKVSEQVDMLLSLETSYSLPKPEAKILVMGGVAYNWSWEVIKSSNWSHIVVPSEHAQQLLARKRVQSEVIYNGYDWKPFVLASLTKNRARTTNKQKTLISPHRPDAAKGHYEAVLLTRNLIMLGIDCTLRIPRQDFFMTPKNFYDDLSKFAQEHIGHGNFILDPWVNTDSMPHYYADADLTMALGSAQEGFGAVVVESIVSGTPVLATSRGAIPTLVPEEHGLFLVAIDEQTTEKATNLIIKIITGQLSGLDESIRRGQRFICSRYDKTNMTRSYIDLVKGIFNPVKGI